MKWQVINEWFLLFLGICFFVSAIVQLKRHEGKRALRRIQLVCSSIMVLSCLLLLIGDAM